MLIVVPVYNGLEFAAHCLQSLREANVSVPHRTLVIDDASPDANAAASLESLTHAMPNTQLRHNAVNRGFTWNVNQAMAALQTNEHLLLLNSDTIVTDGWLDEIMRTALSDARIGTITPFSNNATICSLPDFQRAWPVPDAAKRAQIAQALVYDRAEAIDIPTGVGFCMLMMRACIDAVGRYDIKNFPRGYGEENDFCMRALAAGFRNVLCPNAYVAHEGGVSFIDAAQALMQIGGERLLAKHPHYNDLVSDWVTRDPARERREQIAQRLLS